MQEATGIARSESGPVVAGALPVLVQVGPEPRYNRKDRSPSEGMTESDGRHYRCDWIEGSITVHSDGNVSCGLDDPHASRSFGNVKDRPIEEIFGNPEYDRLRAKLWEGHRCVGCGLYRSVEGEEGPSTVTRPRLPNALVVETTVKCNLRCPNTACIPNNNALLKTRDEDSLGLETLERVADQLAASLETIHFYNYGEPFLNRQAEAMLLYLREKCPGALIVTSTNGIPLSKAARADNVVLAAPDRVIFTISGITQDIYGRYHAAGRCDQALAGLKNVCDAKRRSGQSLPAVVVRYLVFHWNDSDEQIDGVIALAEEYGVDRLTLFLTDEPKGSRSSRFSPGSPSYLKYKQYLHFDHLGRLDHLYHCELPDDDGLYRPEEIPGFGRVRRTASAATLRRDGRSRQLRLSIATDRPSSRDRPIHCVVRTPWRDYRVRLTFGTWRNVSIRVAEADRRPGPVEIGVSTDDYWFPAGEFANADLRCLGVLVRSEPLFEAGMSRLRRTLLRSLATLRRTWRRRIAPRFLGWVLTSWGIAPSGLSARWKLPEATVGGPTGSEIVAGKDAPFPSRSHEGTVIRLYRTLLGRAPEAEGLSSWVETLASGRCSPIQVAQDFISSAEFRDVHGADPSPEAFAAAACRNALGREPDPDDLRHWVDFLSGHGNGKPARAATALGIAETMAVAVDATPDPEDAGLAAPGHSRVDPGAASAVRRSRHPWSPARRVLSWGRPRR